MAKFTNSEDYYYDNAIYPYKSNKIQNRKRNNTFYLSLRSGSVFLWLGPALSLFAIFTYIQSGPKGLFIYLHIYKKLSPINFDSCSHLH